MGDERPAEEYADLERLFRPRSIAVIGVSQNPTKGGGFIWWRITEQGYTGEKYPISKSCTDINGVKCYESISEVEASVDMAIIAVPAAVVESVLRECIKKKVKFVIIHSAGFAELGEEGKPLQKGLNDAIQSGETRVVGPNCMGLFSPGVKLNTIVEVDKSELQAGNVSFSGQSGWATENFIAEGTARGLKFSTVISSGNQADLDIYDYVSFYGRDPHTRVISAYLEGNKRGKRFFDLARRVSSEKPVIIWKAGHSAAGAKAAMSHTGSIAGNQEMWDGAARSAGIVSVVGFEELTDMSVAFSSPIYPAGKKVGIMVEAGGGGISAADACDKLGLEVNSFSDSLKKRLKDYLINYLPPFSGISNPLDLVWLPADRAMELCVTCVELIAEEIDVIISMSYLPFFSADLRSQYIETLGELRDKLKLPIFIVPPYASRGMEGMKECTAAGLPALPTFERASKAVKATYDYQKWHKAESS